MQKVTTKITRAGRPCTGIAAFFYPVLAYGLYKTGALRLWRNSGHGDDLHTASFIPYY